MKTEKAGKKRVPVPNLQRSTNSVQSTIKYKDFTDLRSIFCHCLKTVIMYDGTGIKPESLPAYNDFVESAYNLAEQANVFDIPFNKENQVGYLKNEFAGIAGESKEKFVPKPELIQHLARTNPLLALNEVFERTKLHELTVDTTQWLTAALTNENSIYSIATDRLYLIWFFEWLNVVYLASFTIFHETRLEPGESNHHLSKLQQDYLQYRQTKGLPDDKLTDPTLIIRSLCAEFGISHARSELWDWLEAGLSNERFYTTKLTLSNLLYNYQHILAVVEAAYSLNDPSKQY